MIPTIPTISSVRPIAQESHAAMMVGRSPPRESVAVRVWAG